MKKLLLIAGCWIITSCVSAQEKRAEQPDPEFNVGLGLGLDYGGLGARFTLVPLKEFFVYGSLGYNLAGLGYSAGGGYRFSPQNRTCPYIIGMYGHNAVVIVFINGQYESRYTRAFTGASAGFGLEQHAWAKAKNYFNAEILYHFRSQAFKAYKNELRDNLGATFIMLPISFSLGYHIGF